MIPAIVVGHAVSSHCHPSLKGCKMLLCQSLDASGKPAKLDDPADLYAGCKVRASINFYGFDQKGNKGVAVGLRNIQKLSDGERLDGRKKASDEFDAVEEAAFNDSLM